MKIRVCQHRIKNEFDLWKRSDVPHSKTSLHVPCFYAVAVYLFVAVLIHYCLFLHLDGKHFYDMLLAHLNISTIHWFKFTFVFPFFMHIYAHFHCTTKDVLTQLLCYHSIEIREGLIKKVGGKHQINNSQSQMWQILVYLRIVKFVHFTCTVPNTTVSIAIKCVF